MLHNSAVDIGSVNDHSPDVEVAYTFFACVSVSKAEWSMCGE
jgi:hypothetical protein